MTPTHAPHTLLVLSALLLGAGACSSPSGDLGDYTGSDDETRGNAETTTTTTTTETTTETATTTGTTTTPTAETTTTTTTGGEQCPLEEAADQCCCFTYGMGCGEEPTQVLCEATVACDDIMQVSANNLGVENPEALECALTALRDRTPGQIRVRSRWGLGDPVDGWLFLYVQADGTVFASSGATADDPYANELVHRELPAAEVFEQCLLEPDVEVRLACVEMALYGKALETCLPRCDTGVP